MRIRQTSIYSQKQVKCGEENIGMRKRICYHLGLRQQTIPEGLNRGQISRNILCLTFNSTPFFFGKNLLHCVARSNH